MHDERFERTVKMANDARIERLLPSYDSDIDVKDLVSGYKSDFEEEKKDDFLKIIPDTNHIPFFRDVFKGRKR